MTWKRICSNLIILKKEYFPESFFFKVSKLISKSNHLQNALSPNKKPTQIRGSSPCLRPAHHLDSKGLRSGIDLRRIPHKMLETPASHKEEPDAWILSVSKPGLHYQNSA